MATKNRIDELCEEAGLNAQEKQIVRAEILKAIMGEEIDESVLTPEMAQVIEQYLKEQQ